MEDVSSPVHFHVEGVEPPVPQPERLVPWLCSVAESEDKTIEALNFIFCDDSYLHEMNVEYLGHDTYTDIITFDHCEPPAIIGDIFISLDRVKENADGYGILFEDELHRVMAHGLLHLMGYPDATDEEKQVMRGKEDEALNRLDISKASS